MRGITALGRLRSVVRDDGSLPPASYFCESCENDERKTLEVQSVLRELELLVAAGKPTRNPSLLVMI
jgi:hypothetical protein